MKLNFFSRPKQLRRSVRPSRNGRLGIESLEDRRLLAIDSVAPFSFSRNDVNRDGIVSPADVLRLINDINANGAHAAKGAQAFAAAAAAPGASTSTTIDPFDVNGDGMVSPRDVLQVINAVNAAEDILVNITPVVTDTSGNAITSIGVGGDFILKIFVKDARTTGADRGVFSAYTDVTYQSAFADVIGAITYGADYPNGHKGDTSTGGLIDEGGAFDGSTPLGASQRLLFQVPMRATNAGTLTFLTDPADLPQDETLLFNPGDPVVPSQIDFQSVTLTVNAQPSVGFTETSFTVAEGGSGQNNPVTLTVALSQAVNQQVTVNFATANGTAIASQDYVPTSGTLIFAPGQTQKTIVVTTIGNNTPQPSRNFFVNLSQISGPVQTINAKATVTIVDDDGSPTVTITPSVGNFEGAKGTLTPFVFTVTASGTSASAYTVSFNTANGTAKAGVDYQPAAGTVTFNPGDLTKTITVNAIGNNGYAPDKTFFLNLNPSANNTYNLGNPSQGVGTIFNDDAIPTITINDVTVQAPSSGTTPMVYTVTFNGLAESAATVNFATANGTAKAGTNYVANSGTLTFPVPADGTTTTQTQQITVQATNDPAQTTTLQYFVNLTNPVNAEITDNQGVGTITPLIVEPKAQIRLVLSSDASGLTPITSIKGGQEFFLVAFTKDLRVTVPDASKGVFSAYLNVGFNPTQVQTTGAIQYGTDYPNAQRGNANTLQGVGATANSTPLGAGEERLFSVPVKVIQNIAGTVNFAANPDLNPGDEVSVFGEDNPLPPQAVTYLGTSITVLPASTVSVADASTTVGQDLVFSVTVTRQSDDTDKTISVQYATSPGTAVPGVNYNDTSGTLTFAPGETTKAVTVTTLPNSNPDINRTLFLTLSNPTNAVLANSQATGTIINPIAAPVLSITDATATAGLGNAVFTLTLDKVSSAPITVNFSTANGTAVAGVNYVAQSGSVTFNPGQTSKQITVQVLSGSLDDVNRTFFLNLTGIQNATLSRSQAVGTILSLKSSSLAGFVFGDTNLDGNHQSAELGLQGITLTLTGTTTFGQAVSRTVKTDASGRYSFTGLLGGTYTLSIVQPSSLVLGKTSIGSQGGSLVGPGAISITLGFGVNGVDNNFAENGVLASFLSQSIFFASSGAGL